MPISIDADKPVNANANARSVDSEKYSDSSERQKHGKQSVTACLTYSEISFVCMCVSVCECVGCVPCVSVCVCVCVCVSCV
jgi:hypothetical protein